MQDLDKIKDDLKLVKAKIAIKRYNAAYDYVQGLRKEEKELKRRKRELEDANAPLVEERKRLEAEVKDLQGAAKQAGDKYNEVGRKNTEYVNRLDASEKDVEDKRVSLKRIKENEKKIQKKIEEEANELEKAKRFLTQTKKELEDAGVPVDDNDLPSGRYAEVIAELNNISRQLRELEDRRNEIDANSQPFKTQSRDLIHERDRVLQELERLDSATEQRRARLRAKDPDTGKAMDWIRNNGGTSNNGQNALQAAPFDPILVEMNLKESRFASIVEAMVPFRLLKV